MKNFLSQIKPLSVPLMTKDQVSSSIHPSVCLSVCLLANCYNIILQLTKLAGLIKRLAFVLFAGEVDQYEDLLQDMQGLLGGRG